MLKNDIKPETARNENQKWTELLSYQNFFKNINVLFIMYFTDHSYVNMNSGQMLKISSLLIKILFLILPFLAHSISLNLSPISQEFSKSIEKK